MNTLQNNATRTKQLTTRSLQRLIFMIAFMLAGMMLSFEAVSGGWSTRFTDPDFTANGVKQCPDAVKGCSFEINVLDFSIDAFVCPNGSILYPNSSSTPAGCFNGLAHFDSGITLSSLGKLTECTKNGSCKIKITDIFLLTDLAAAINAEIPGNGQSVATFQDTYETCPAERIKAMTVSINGFVCDSSGVNANGSCVAGTQGSYYNAIGVFDPMFNSVSVIDDLCMHGNFSTNPTIDCYDNTAPYACETTYP